MSEVMLRVENLKKSFDGRVVLDGIDLQVHQGEVVAVIGPSGTGKSTLLRCIDLLELPDEGSITIGEVAVQAPGISRRQQYQLRAQTAMVFQQYSLFANKTALQNVTEGLIVARKMPKAQALEIGRQALEKVGLYLEATGTGESGKVFSQSVNAGTVLDVGTAVEVKFTDDTAPDNGVTTGGGWAPKEEEE